MRSGWRAYGACSRASTTNSVRMELLVRQPTMRRANRSMTKATYCQRNRVVTYVKSGTQSWLGRSALNCLLTWSSGHGTALPAMAVRTTLPRRPPRRPESRMRRSKAQRAQQHLRGLLGAKPYRRHRPACWTATLGGFAVAGLQLVWCLLNATQGRAVIFLR